MRSLTCRGLQPGHAEPYFLRGLLRRLLEARVHRGEQLAQSLGIRRIDGAVASLPERAAHNLHGNTHTPRCGLSAPRSPTELPALPAVRTAGSAHNFHTLAGRQAVLGGGARVSEPPARVSSSQHSPLATLWPTLCSVCCLLSPGQG